MAAKTNTTENMTIEMEKIESLEVKETKTEEIKEEPKTVAQLDAEAKKWGKELAKEEKVKVKIKSKTKGDVAPVPVGINGYFFWINKNETVEVPKSVAKILEEADYI